MLHGVAELRPPSVFCLQPAVSIYRQRRQTSTIFYRLDNRLTGWSIQAMKTVGIFEAKTHLPGLCQQVAETGAPVMISRRGHPLVMITPVPDTLVQPREDILAAWTRWEREHGVEESGDFPEVWNLRRNREDHPLAG